MRNPSSMIRSRAYWATTILTIAACGDISLTSVTPPSGGGCGAQLVSINVGQGFAVGAGNPGGPFTVPRGNTVVFGASGYFESPSGCSIDGPQIDSAEWSSTNPSVLRPLEATASPALDMMVHASELGAATVRAQYRGVVGSARVDVVPVRRLTAFTAISAGSSLSCAVTVDETLHCWGLTDFWGRTGNLDLSSCRGAPVVPCDRVPTATTYSFSQVDLGAESGCGLSAAGEATCWNLLGSNRFVAAGEARFTVISVGAQHVCGLTTEGIALCWGRNTYRQFGDGSNVFQRSEALPVAGGARFSELSSGAYHTCGLAAGGEIHCWGSNEFSQLGARSSDQCTPGFYEPSVRCSATPLLVSRGLEFHTLATGSGANHTCALDAEGAAFCWGSNEHGQLGVGSTGGSAAEPMAVHGSLVFESISTGARHTCAVTPDGHAHCWGANDGGQLGLPPGGPHAVPTRVGPGFAWSVLDAGVTHTCGLTTDGVGLCWGRNEMGQLGTGTLADHHAPVPVAGHAR